MFPCFKIWAIDLSWTYGHAYLCLLSREPQGYEREQFIKTSGQPIINVTKLLLQTGSRVTQRLPLTKPVTVK
jgi:hypothetical protein